MLRQFRRRTHMIKMTMGQQNLLQRHASIGNLLFDRFGVTTWIDKRRQLSLLTPDQRTVLPRRQ
ncbi:Uncharacterised protein [Kluyvera cryocrescens]|uniref:Uncharacterized protein n=1 Tax=Kluyvera cryocrescens TaxID=580 RepID=A0A485CWZ8_KLUCR|nr:Uncharacterised protein [Kluyvera cryocrescens]